MPPLDERVAALAARHRPLAARILRGGHPHPGRLRGQACGRGRRSPLCGLSNHEGPRLEYLKRTIVEIGAVRRPEDVAFDAFGNLVWVVQDEADGIPAREKRVIYIDGHADTVQALRAAVAREDERRASTRTTASSTSPGSTAACCGLELGYLPPDDEWDHLLFGRGSADQLAGVVSQIVATKILLELAAGGRAARRDRALVRHRRRGGQRRRRPAPPDGPRPARRAARPRPRRRHPHRGHRRLEEGRARASTAASAAGCRSRWRSPAAPATARCRGKA